MNIYTGDRNKEDLRVSRKYATGTIHETATGKFVILDRFKNEEGEITLEFQWLSGEYEGKVDHNKEVNINATIHKFQVSRGITPQTMPNTRQEPFIEKINDIHESVLMYEPIIEKIDEILETVSQSHEARETLRVKLDEMTETIRMQQTMIQALTETIDRTLERATLMEKQQSMMEKLIDKLA